MEFLNKFEQEVIELQKVIDESLSQYQTELSSFNNPEWDLSSKLLHSEQVYNKHSNKPFNFANSLYPIVEGQPTVTINGMTYARPDILFRFELHRQIRQREKEFLTIKADFERSLENQE